jgi:flagellar biosynthetic protein FliO
LCIAALFLAVFLPHGIFSQTEAAGVSNPAGASNPGVASTAANGAAAGAVGDSAAAADGTATAVGASAETPAQGPGTAASRAEENALWNTQDPASGEAEAPSGTSSVFAIFRMVLVLALVAGLIYLVVYFLRRIGKPQVEQNPHLKILASTYLGSGRYVHVVTVGKEAWLIGSGEGGVRHIADISDHEAVDAMALAASEKKAETPEPFNFQSMLKKFSGGLSAKEQDRLEKMRERREKFKRF